MIKILLLVPLTGNGGIASWTKKFIETFPDEEFAFFPLNISPDRNMGSGFMNRIFTGLKALKRVMRELRQNVTTQHFDIMHTTTSGSIGTLRDYCVAKYCKKHGLKTVMHCHYGCIPQDVKSKGLLGHLLRKTMCLYDQIWVLDNKSYEALNEFSYLRGKVFLTPNSIEVNESVDLKPKAYYHVAFIGNLIPSKGIYELTKAVVLLESYDVFLDIIGPGSDEVVEQLKAIAGNEWGKRIKWYGKLPNEEAVKFMKSVDIVALPTYYPSEAFPISILEAMSLSKLVISTRRAAIPDMLSLSDGTYCGLLVREKSVEDIAEAIRYCIGHSKEVDAMCQKAYEKVFSSYRKEVVYEIYRENYSNLLKA